MDDAIERFCDAHFAYNGITPARQADVRRALADFRAHADKPLEDTDAGDFGAWMRALVERGLHVNTVRKMGNCVRPFYRWAWRDARLVDAETFMRIGQVENPRGATAQAVPRPYSRKQLDAFWREFDAAWPMEPGQRFMARFLDGRSRFHRVSAYAMHRQLDAIVHLALHCGLRRSEVYGLTLDDVHPDNEYIVVRGAAKGAAANRGPKLREVPFTTSARAAVARWLSVRAQVMRKFGVEHDSVWLGLNPRASANSTMPSSPAAPLNSRRMAELVGTIGDWELHRFRHTCGTEWLRAGMAIEQVQVLLGHARIQQTLGYAEVAGRDVVRGALKAEQKFDSATSRRAA